MTELFNYMLAGGGLLILGFNASLIAHTRKIVRAVLAWRMFIIGKSGLTLYVTISLYVNRDQPINWRLPLAAFAIMLTLISVWLLDRTYRHRGANALAPPPM